ncbi:MAG: thioredoxin family protein [Rhodobacterales bacterium CG2_30_65_12]|nr:MAG: thioredoxin family protein [Rhodobacterales bacterium CG2_30_65_12]
MAAIPPVCDFGAAITDFSLPDPATGKPVSLADVSGENGTLVMFICNHCPYVRAVIDRIVRDAKALQALGVGVVAISANDVAAYPEDAPEQMVTMAEKNGFTFPYLYDESQEVARAFEAVCTPDFFGYNAAGKLQYRGRLDASRREAGPADLRRDLFEAMKQVAETGKGPKEQVASIGCSIKWKE